MILLFLFNAALADTFEYNGWQYGECVFTKVENVLHCQNEKQVCILDLNSINNEGKAYIKIACKDKNDKRRSN